MWPINELLLAAQRFRKLYNKMSESICEKYRITKKEMDIISFLYNNPSYDTARDIVELRHFTKSHVSQSVESLIQKELLCRKADAADRRRIHLKLLPNTQELVTDISAMQANFLKSIYHGFTEDEKRQHTLFLLRIAENAKIALKKE